MTPATDTETAVRAVRRGLAVFPLPARGRVPAPGWQRLATLDEAALPELLADDRNVTAAFTASVLARARRICRQCRDRHAEEQNTAVAFADGISGPPHPRHNRGPGSSAVTATSRSRGTSSLPMQQPYEGKRPPGRTGGLAAILRPTKVRGRLAPRLCLLG